MHEYERLKAYQVKKNLKKLEETLRKKIGVSERGLGDEKTEVSRERSTKMSCGSTEGVERYREICHGRCRMKGRR